MVMAGPSLNSQAWAQALTNSSCSWQSVHRPITYKPKSYLFELSPDSGISGELSSDFNKKILFYRKWLDFLT